MPLQSDKLRLLRRIPDIRFEEESRGYSKDQVDRVLANLAPLADEIERLQARVAESESRAASAEARLVEARSPAQQATAGVDASPVPQPDFDETLRNTLVSAQRQADTTIREAREEAERLRTEAEFQSNALLADARDQSSEMTTEAVAYRERLMAEAASERANLLDEAKQEAQTRVDAVERELAEAHDVERSKLIAQIKELQDNHQLLQSDVSRFEQHLQGRTADVRVALDQISAVLDDPEGLRAKDEIDPADIEALDESNYPPIAVGVDALDELESEAAAAAEATARPGQTIEAADLDELVDEDPVEEETSAVPPPDDIQESPSTVFDNDPQIGVQTQYLDPNDATQIVAPTEIQGQVPPPPPPAPGQGHSDGEDPFLGELRRVTNEAPDEQDAIADFLDEKPDTDRGNNGGWFGRRR